MSPAAVQAAEFGQLSVRVLHAILKLRCEIFVVEQHCAYLDIDGRDAEPTTVHLWIEDETAEVVAALRLLVDPDGSTRIGRVVTAPSQRGKGLAATLLTAAITRNPSDVAMVLGAQAQLESWYGQFGFVRNGDVFLEDGIPHVPMIRGAQT
jgi:ElaA protein